MTRQRTRLDFAHQLKLLVDVYYPKAKLIHVVLDNLNIHKISTLYDAFEPEEAARIRRKLCFHHTPIHGSWLNMVEIEIGILLRQCLNRRISDIPTIKDEIAAWENIRNKERSTIDWTFTADAAREKLKRLYPAFSAQ